jgi:putative oxidoreductase
MNHRAAAKAADPRSPVATGQHPWSNADIFARLALAAAFLSAVADRLGFWGPYSDGVVISWGDMAHFYAAVAALSPWAPQAAIPGLSWLVTALEAALGLLLIVGWQLRWVALVSALLLLVFAVSMAAFLSPKLMLNYSVLSCAACAFLLHLRSK